MEKYNHEKIEKKWQKKWASSKLYKSKENAKAKKYYVLDMFPYPSGEGLHVGHPKGYIATDIVSRYRRMNGCSVLHPMGFDAFGLPTENYALKTKTNPADSVKKNVAKFKRQLEIIGFDYDWSREINTTDPKYYKWTQWVFLQLFKKGLAYESYEPINWCPTCKTGLANEDLEGGRCERCGTPVEKKPMRQWVLKITDYAERLLQDLDAEGGYEIPKVIDKANPHQDNKPIVKRYVAHAIVFNPKNRKYLINRNKKHGWDTVIIGGIENGENIVETARREVKEETGYIDIEFKRILGGQTEAHYFAKHKGENRVAIAQAVYFELKSDKRVPISDGEDKDDEVLWVDREHFIPGKMVNSELSIWLERIKDSSMGWPKPLLNWPESIKELQRNWIGKSEGTLITFPIKRDVNFVLLHGWEGSPERNFFPWLRAELERAGYTVQVPSLPNTDNPVVKDQVEHVLHSCTFNEKTVILGHSLGATVAMKVLEKLQTPINTLILAAGFIENRFKDGSTFEGDAYDWEYNFDVIRRKAKNVKILRDLADSVVPNNQADKIREKLGGTIIDFKAIEGHICAKKEPFLLPILLPEIPVFTTRPDTLFGVTYVVLAPEHKLVSELINSISNKKEVEDYVNRAGNETEIERTDAKKDKTGVELKGIKAINPANNEKVPVWVADYVLADYGTGAVMAVPAHDERDWEFAKKFNMIVREVISDGNTHDNAYIGNGKLVNSNEFNGTDSLEAKKIIIERFGQKKVTYKLRDWVFSRQRYWGEPIPIIHCEKCGIVSVPEKDLPVKLPKVKSYEPTGTGESPLAAISKWVNVKCPVCRGPAKRETNTMPQWAGSSWYYLRYMDPKNNKQLINPVKEKYWAPVDLYVGGAEHATRHLIYARFWHKFLYDLGAVSTVEPFIKLQHVGLIMGEDGKKMSKRFGNVVNPDDIVRTYGADTLRVYEMFMGPFDQQITWNASSIIGARRFIEKVWRLRDCLEPFQPSAAMPTGRQAPVVEAATSVDLVAKPTKTLRRAEEGADINRILHRTTKKVTEDIMSLKFNTAISSLMIAVNEMEKVDMITNEQFAILLKLLAPFAPHIAEELWITLGNKKSIHISEWPKYNPNLIASDKIIMAIQVNGKMRGSFEAGADENEEKIRTKVLTLPDMQKWISGKEIKKFIVVKNKLVSIVI
jgi:leucyl-tRNA synthetase